MTSANGFWWVYLMVNPAVKGLCDTVKSSWNDFLWMNVVKWHWKWVNVATNWSSNGWNKWMSTNSMYNGVVAHESNYYWHIEWLFKGLLNVNSSNVGKLICWHLSWWVAVVDGSQVQNILVFCIVECVVSFQVFINAGLVSIIWCCGGLVKMEFKAAIFC